MFAPMLLLSDILLERIFSLDSPSAFFTLLSKKSINFIGLRLM